MTAPGPRTTPTSRRAARAQREADAARPTEAEGAVNGEALTWVTDAPAEPSRRSNFVDGLLASDEMFVEPDLGNLVPDGASLPRVHRSTFITDRRRPTPLPPVSRARQAGQPPARETEPAPADDAPATTPVDSAPAAARAADAPAGAADAPAADPPADDALAGSARADDSRTDDSRTDDAPAEDAADPAHDATPPATGPTRRAAREADLLEPTAPPTRHAGTRRAARLRALFGVIAAAVLVLGAASAVTAALTGSAVSDTAGHRVDEGAPDAAVEASVTVAVPLPAPAESIPAPEVSVAPAYVDVCADSVLTDALAAGDDAGVVALAGGGEPFRAAIAAGLASCVPLDDPSHLWVVVNKQRPYNPADYSPSDLAMPGVRDLADSPLQAEASAALTAMVAGAAAAGVGEIALSSGFRSYAMQRSTYGSQVNARGTESAELVSARPGHSEHQSGLAADVVACADGVCGGLDGLAATPQGAWVADHAWEYGWIVRYEEGHTAVTGYAPEPWHLRYLGPELAAAYHDGGWHTLEEFFGLPPAPGYVD